jgi:hypothetical protein
LAPLARRWHVFILLDVIVSNNPKLILSILELI